MVISFCSGVGASIANQWITVSGTCGDDFRVMTRNSVDDPGRPLGIVLSAATSLWLPVSPKRVFDFLRDENNRSQVFSISSSQYSRLINLNLNESSGSLIIGKV